MEEKIYELTNPQKSIWLTEQYYNGTSINNICGSVLVKEKLNIELFNLAINKFIENNDSFRLRFKLIDGNCYQYLTKNEFISFEVINLKNMNSVKKLANDIVKVPFDFYESRLFDFKIFKLDNGNGGFIVNVHHIISDAATLSFVGTEIIDIYSKLIDNEPLPEKTFSYIDYINSEKEYLKSSRFEKDKEYWNTLLSPVPDVATIPSLKNNEDSPAANRLEFSFDQKLLDKIISFCKKSGISVYNFLMAVYGIYIGRVNNMDSFTIGTPILNRTNFAEKHTSGMFISTSLLKLNTEQNLSFREFAQNIAKDSMQMLRHQKYNYQCILDDLRKDDKSIANLYDVLLSYQITQATKIDSKVPYESTWHATPYVANSMAIHFHDNNDSGNLLIEYDYKICKYDKIDIQNMHARIVCMINQILENNEINIHDIEIVTKEEKHMILDVFNDTSEKFSYSDNLYIEIEKVARSNADKIAIESENNSITYKELTQRVNQLCNMLINKYKIKERSCIGISTNRTIDTIVGILSILKINCTYVPIDPTYPQIRIDHMIRTSKLNYVLTDKVSEDKNVFLNLNLLDISYLSYCNEDFNIKYDFNYSIDEDLYIIFTSGSTGTPKGVTLSHKNMLNLISYEKEKTNIFKENSRILQFATMSFDVSYQEIYSALLTGNTLVLIDDLTRKDIQALSLYIKEKQINVLFIPPAYLRLLAENADTINILSETVKSIITAGEQLIITEGIKTLINNRINLYNHYGPAETHVATAYHVSNNSKQNPPIGFPIANTQIIILDKSYHLSPIGIIGQIAISGNCVGNGYVNNKDLTEKKFITHHFTNKKLYLTGDLGYFDLKGCLHYIGRADSQIKINGYRIELDEVSNGILKLPYVHSAYIIPSTDKFGKKILLAFIKFHKDTIVPTIKKDLYKILPSYMIPSIFYKISSIPLTINGKVDNKKILNNLNTFEVITTSNNHYTEPSNDLEKTLLKLFQNILCNNTITLEDNFFEFGGDSLMAIALQSECSKHNILFNTQQLYDFPTVKDLSKHLSSTFSNVNNDLNRYISTLTEKKVKIKKYTNIFLTGANGFLGIHVLYQLLKTHHKIYCSVRSTNTKTSEQRLIEIYKYYFGEDISDLINTKIFIIDCDLSKEYIGLTGSEYQNLRDNIDIIINCAASVKHYTTRSFNYKNNVLSTTNLINLAQEGRCLFNHISTIGIAGNDLVDTNSCFKNTFSEKDLFINQAYSSNVYIETKFQAEQLILENINKKSISANIMRVGNLMNRLADNKFQIDPKSNAFQNKIKALASIGVITEDFTNFVYDITPVDLCALAVVKLSLNNSYNNIYHVLNSKELTFTDIKNLLLDNGIEVKIVSRNDITNIYNHLSDDQYNNYKWLINDFILHNKERILIDSKMTQDILNSLDFNWNIVDNNYYKRVFDYILKGDVNNSGKNNF